MPLNMELQSLKITKNNKFAPAQKEVRTMKVKVIKRYNDLILKKIQEKDTVFDVTESRGKYLIEQGMVIEIKESAKDQNPEPKDAKIISNSRKD